MTKKELAEKINSLEARIRCLESRPIVITMPTPSYQQQYYNPYQQPYITCQTTNQNGLAFGGQIANQGGLT